MDDEKISMTSRIGATLFGKDFFWTVAKPLGPQEAEESAAIATAKQFLETGGHDGP